ncbi:PP2C family serine/threonine-protein phosphatase [Streptomyces sp. NPDC006553]|uniref:PP2C family serine/threonine-protein phosphatase n=1 Tax=unclassified Streptomyces TaxID=2593676 RepID=UPI00225047FA|nr:PP2C family serine/threonine-protein phosphatase [Streptomyces sp. NBC_00233]MCX5226255.1 serine/threonine-protein phosphatase [Streptomyces sp. NBC_00233]
MSQKPKPSHGLTVCPDCAEPLESGDRFCGACGYDLTAVPVAGVEPDRPTVAIGTPVAWPDAPPRDPGSLSTATQHPGDLPGTDSGGRDLPTMAVRTDGPVPPGGDPAGETTTGSGDFELAAPDPRAAVRVDPPPAAPAPAPAPSPAPAPAPAAQAPAPDPAAAAAVPGSALCVACRAGRVDTDGYCENCGHAQPRERDHMEQELDSVAAVSDRGLRHHRNEDAFAVSATTLPDGSPATLAIVCDGVSSATRPDEASAAAAEAAGASLLAALPRGTHPQQAMHEAIVAAAEAVNSLAEEPGQDGAEHDPHRHRNAPACTIVGSVVADGLLVVGWVGDSRVYWVPDDRATPAARLTEDDSWAAQMVAAGLMNEAEAYADERAHAITGWLGADAYELEPHTAAFKPDRSGVVVVCTDGLWNYAEGADDMARVVPADASDRPLHGAQVLVGHALDGGGHDNITVALVPFTVAPPGAGSA